MKISLIGLPASGKGTLAKKLGVEFNLPVIQVGHLLRDTPPESTRYEEIHKFMDKGLMVPPPLVGQMIKEYIEEQRISGGFILDGWLRQLEDLQVFDPEIDVMLYLNISEETSKKRINNRLVCRAEGHPYNLLVNPPKIEGICDFDGSELINRKDDDPAVLENRFNVFRVETIKVLEHYKKEGLLVEIDGEPSPNAVFDNAKGVIKTKLEQMV